MKLLMVIFFSHCLLCASTVYSQKQTIAISSFGAIANDSLFDNHQPIVKAIEYASQSGIRNITIPAGVFFISKGFLLPDSFTISGAGIEKTVIKLMYNLAPRSNEAQQTAVFTGDRSFSLSSGAATRHISLRNFTIALEKQANQFDINKFPMLGGVRFINPVNCLIDSVRITLPQKFGIGFYATRDGKQCSGNTIKNCQIEMEADWYLQQIPEIIPRSAESCIGIELSSFAGQHNNGAAVSIDRNNNEFYASKTKGNRIISTSISGGSHGISISNGDGNKISGNLITGCSNRGIIIISCSDNNVISNNSIIASGSTAIHLAYGCEKNKIMNNIVSGILGVEGDGIKCYINCNNNTISGNKVSEFATTGIRVSHGANKNLIRNNQIIGTGVAGQTGIKIISNNKNQYADGFTFNGKLKASNNKCYGNIIQNVETGILVGNETTLKNTLFSNKVYKNNFKNVSKKSLIKE